MTLFAAQQEKKMVLPQQKNKMILIMVGQKRVHYNDGQNFATLEDAMTEFRDRRKFMKKFSKKFSQCSSGGIQFEYF